MFFCKKVVLLFLLLFLFCTNLYAETVTRSIHIEWGYTPPSEPAVIGFKLYKEGVQSCQVMSADSSAMNCFVIFTKTQTSFTLTALFSDGTESPHSAPFLFTLPTEDTVNNNTGSNLVTFNWEASDTTLVKGYKLYMNDTLVCESYNKEERNRPCNTTVPKGTVTFYMTSVFTDDTESTPSNNLIYTN